VAACSWCGWGSRLCTSAGLASVGGAQQVQVAVYRVP
jgi:hypothetical protein